MIYFDLLARNLPLTCRFKKAVISKLDENQEITQYFSFLSVKWHFANWVKISKLENCQVDRLQYF